MHIFLLREKDVCFLSLLLRHRGSIWSSHCELLVDSSSDRSDIEAVSGRFIVSFWLTRVVTRHFQHPNFLKSCSSSHSSSNPCLSVLIWGIPRRFVSGIKSSYFATSKSGRDLVFSTTAIDLYTTTISKATMATSDFLPLASSALEKLQSTIIRLGQPEFRNDPKLPFQISIIESPFPI